MSEAVGAARRCADAHAPGLRSAGLTTVEKPAAPPHKSAITAARRPMCTPIGFLECQKSIRGRNEPVSVARSRYTRQRSSGVQGQERGRAAEAGVTRAGREPGTVGHGAVAFVSAHLRRRSRRWTRVARCCFSAAPLVQDNSEHARPHPSVFGIGRSLRHRTPHCGGRGGRRVTAWHALFTSPHFTSRRVSSVRLAPSPLTDSQPPPMCSLLLSRQVCGRGGRLAFRPLRLGARSASSLWLGHAHSRGSGICFPALCWRGKGAAATTPVADSAAAAATAAATGYGQCSSWIFAAKDERHGCLRLPGARATPYFADALRAEAGLGVCRRSVPENHSLVACPAPKCPQFWVLVLPSATLLPSLPPANFFPPSPVGENLTISFPPRAHSCVILAVCCCATCSRVTLTSPRLCPSVRGHSWCRRARTR